MCGMSERVGTADVGASAHRHCCHACPRVQGQTVVEASSGNTGIGLAMVCAARGYPFVCVMAESFSIERRKLMRFLGAKVVLTNPAHKGSGMAIKAAELAKEHGWFLPQQFANEANAQIHEETTGPEILDALADEGLPPPDYFFTAYGTGGTLKGVARYLRRHSPATTICVTEPDNAPLLYSGVRSEYIEDEDGVVQLVEPHPAWRPHLLQVATALRRQAAHGAALAWRTRVAAALAYCAARHRRRRRSHGPSHC